jgi:UDP-N-acetylmuramoyl-L-alanyl-D-glutamate--2,6-diaminopimelate ligase
MKLLKDILYGTRILDVIGSTHTAIEHVAFDSRAVKPFGLYVAIPGVHVDGHDFIPQAIAAGAIAIVCEEMPGERKEGLVYVRVHDARKALGHIAAGFYDHPTERMQVVAITGTNGKTTTATLLHKLFRQMDRKAGLLSTVENRIVDRVVPSTHTTPDALQMQRLFREMADAGCRYVFMEASSHSIHQHRLAGTRLAGAVFTNITQDHLDYHGTFNNYIAAKRGLFTMLPADGFALVNSDDPHAEDMVHDCKARVRDFALKTMADYRARVLENGLSGLQLHLDGHDLYAKLIGHFNASNLLSIYGVARELGFEALDILTHLSLLAPPPGRFEQVESPDGVIGIVDYAHTPDAIMNVLSTITDFRTGNEQVITVIGCGGDRDKTKRPLMARAAAALSDRVILTSDNPRSESPEAIIDDMRAGLDPIALRKCMSNVNRREAIRMAVSFASAPGDIILLAGKGHETYQEINGVRHDFDDRVELRSALNERTPH